MPMQGTVQVWQCRKTNLLLKLHLRMERHRGRRLSRDPAAPLTGACLKQPEG